MYWCLMIGFRVCSCEARHRMPIFTLGDYACIAFESVALNSRIYQKTAFKGLNAGFPSSVISCPSINMTNLGTSAIGTASPRLPKECSTLLNNLILLLCIGSLNVLTLVSANKSIKQKWFASWIELKQLPSPKTARKRAFVPSCENLFPSTDKFRSVVFVFSAAASLMASISCSALLDSDRFLTSGFLQGSLQSV